MDRSIVPPTDASFSKLDLPGEIALRSRHHREGVLRSARPGISSFSELRAAELRGPASELTLIVGRFVGIIYRHARQIEPGTFVHRAQIAGLLRAGRQLVGRQGNPELLADFWLLQGSVEDRFDALQAIAERVAVDVEIGGRGLPAAGL